MSITTTVSLFAVILYCECNLFLSSLTLCCFSPAVTCVALNDSST